MGMYTRHFDLSEEPFSIAANPRFLYMSARHREALALLLYGIRSDSGFVMLTGEVGTGKTTVCRCLMEQLPEQSNVAFILNPKVTVIELLSSICDEFGIDYEHTRPSVKTFVDVINRYLLEQHAIGRNTVVIIDEAQNLSVDVLEQLRLLTNLETNERKLVRIILLGQPELETMLARPELKQVEQRITSRYTLQALDRSEIQAYVSHRLAVAGCRKPVFSAQAINRVYAQTRGIPRLINIVCDRSLLGAYVKSQNKVSPGTVNQAIKEVQGQTDRQRWFQNGSSVMALVLVGATLLASLAYFSAGDLSMLIGQRSDAASVGETINSPLPGDQPFTREDSLKEIPTKTRDSDTELPNWPDTITSATDSNATAQAMLFRQWDKDLDKKVTDPCVQAITWGLRCYSGIGNLGILANNDRPAMLTLLDAEGRQYQATLLSLDNQLATVAFAQGVETVALRDLEARWQGHYQMLWKISPQGLSIFRPGERGPGVKWLTQNLRAVGMENLQQKDLYDADVIEAVKSFQRERGLVADGVAGRQTLIHLNSANDPSIPRLSNQGEG